MSIALTFFALIASRRHSPNSRLSPALASLIAPRYSTPNRVYVRGSIRSNTGEVVRRSKHRFADDFPEPDKFHHADAELSRVTLAVPLHLAQKAHKLAAVCLQDKFTKAEHAELFGEAVRVAKLFFQFLQGIQSRSMPSSISFKLA